MPPESNSKSESVELHTWHLGSPQTEQELARLCRGRRDTTALGRGPARAREAGTRGAQSLVEPRGTPRRGRAGATRSPAEGLKSDFSTTQFQTTLYYCLGEMRGA